VKLAGRGDPVRRAQSDRDRASVRERELIVVGGTRQLRASVGVGETGGDKVRGARLIAPVDDREGAERPREGRAIFARGRL